MIDSMQTKVLNALCELIQEHGYEAGLNEAQVEEIDNSLAFSYEADDGTVYLLGIKTETLEILDMQ